MNIGYIYRPVNYPPSGASSVHVYQTVKGLLNRGHKMYTLQNYSHPQFKKFSKKQVFKFMNEIDLLYVRATGNIFWDSFSMVKFFRKRRLPVVWEFNSAADGVGKSRLFLSVEKRWKMTAKMVDAAICVSEKVADYVRNVIKIKKIQVVPNGSDPDLFSPDKREEGIFAGLDDCIKILWLGSGRYTWQGLDVISKVAKEFLEKNEKIKFILITKKEDINVRGDNIVIVDQVPYLSVAKYIASADICLCLYNHLYYTKNHPEIGFFGSPLKLFDYMACAKPVIASSMGQIKEVIRDGENGFLTDNSVKDIVEKILFLIKNKDKADEIGKAGRADVINHYNWDRACLQTIDVLNDVLANKK